MNYLGRWACHLVLFFFSCAIVCNLMIVYLPQSCYGLFNSLRFTCTLGNRRSYNKFKRKCELTGDKRSFILTSPHRIFSIIFSSLNFIFMIHWNRQIYFFVMFLGLQLLDLSRNQFNGFNEEFSTKLKIIKNVKMENNPLICDRCHMGSLIENAAEVW